MPPVSTLQGRFNQTDGHCHVPAPQATGPARLLLHREEKELVAWQRARMQLNPGRTHHLQKFKYMQKNLESLKNVNSRILVGAPPVEKKLLTIGISSVQRPQGNHLVDTLQSLFFASSSSERKHVTVLVHLAGPDPKWLVQMIYNLSALFKPHIQARELVVITTPLTSYLPLKDLEKTFNNPPAHEAFHSRQNMDYVSLMSFATPYSDYFLMVEDDVRCAPGFVTQIITTVSAWASSPWVMLEFSPLGLTGTLFHTGDMSHFVPFVLLFREMPCADLLSHFQDLSNRTRVQFLPSLFQQVGNSSSFEEDDFGSPSNPAASVHTSLKVANNSVPSNAYSLDENFFYTKSAEPGSHLTIVLKVPAHVSRVEVLTGSDLRGKNQLEEGQVELGCDSTNKVSDCDDYVLLGLLANGILNKQVLSYKSAKKVKCVRLLVTAHAPSGVVVRHINLWTK
ncbi:PREDICTED: alpha-1,3-mannosyl-glycoprotein 4-beta-N-acetylglucosaminyltransferase C-like isoform X1 [Miniopterus natalensis]|uniref:alpha-1,3-mannosyl-glycoprotein 4-beta-N-acetylglucosaminyltransferase C-like isoform X1 n=1 Tax=Miniopterus natalensis TaxID=291302 RepID=UPI0007A71A9A|nr:PREDICTED: alpha-1,3-mannosyl-glycoprotein 4-beta-N-acetylglucosaminyltransferase C-like isoform X1 [Miniopterus natalensis]